MGWFEILKLIIGIVLIIIAAYYSVFFLATRKNKGLAGREIQVYERFSLSKDKMICIMGAKDKAYLVILTNGGATVLETYDISEFERPEAERTGYGAPFPSGPIQRGLLAGFNALKSRLTAKPAAADKSEDQKTDFSATMNRASANDLIATYADREGESPPPGAAKEEESPAPNTAEKEDGIDEIYRRIQNRRASGGHTADEPQDRLEM